MRRTSHAQVQEREPKLGYFAPVEAGWLFRFPSQESESLKTRVVNTYEANSWGFLCYQ
jgi:hypothetical protein